MFNSTQLSAEVDLRMYPVTLSATPHTLPAPSCHPPPPPHPPLLPYPHTPSLPQLIQSTKSIIESHYSFFPINDKKMQTREYCYVADTWVLFGTRFFLCFSFFISLNSTSCKFNYRLPQHAKHK